MTRYWHEFKERIALLWAFLRGRGPMACSAGSAAARSMLEHAMPVTVLGDFGTQREMPENQTSTLAFPHAPAQEAARAGKPKTLKEQVWEAIRPRMTRPGETSRHAANAVMEGLALLIKEIESLRAEVEALKKRQG
jgi:hypothetical protein